MWPRHTAEAGRIIDSDVRAAPDTAPTARAVVIRRTLLWAILVICATLLVATIGESLARSDAEAQVRAAQAHNAAVRQDIQTTQRAVQVAESPDAIERTARGWGYRRPGDHPVIVITPTPSTR